MNPVVEFLHELRARNVAISVEGNQLVCEAAPGVLTPDLREHLAAYKPAILRLLARARVAEPMNAAEGPGMRSPPGLSRAQRSIWLLEQINSGTSIWNVSRALEVQGELDRDALNAAFRAVLERHATLRSRFRNVDGTPVVEHAPLGDWSIDYVDLRELPDAVDQAAELAQAEVRRPFDLERGPLCRARLVRTADTSYVLVLVVHHIVADGWSLGLIGQELSQAYRAALRGEATALPPLGADYQAHVRLERDEEAATQADLDWWRDRLSGELPILSLAADSVRSPSGTGRRVSVELGPGLTDRVEAFARRHRVTSFMVLLAAFKLLIHRYTGQTDLLVGVQTSGRDRPEFADVIGMFVNTLVLRTAVTPDVTAAELLARVRESALESFARQHVAFDRIVDAVKPPRFAGHNPLVRHAFAYQNLPPVMLQLGAAELRYKPLELAGARYELSVEIWPTPKGLLCDFEYATDLFDRETVLRLTAHYRRLVAEIVADPERPICTLPLLSDQERETLLTMGSGRGTDYPAQRRLEDLFAEQAARTPDAPALIWRDREMRYQELDERANQLAHHLRGLGVGRNVLVGVCLERSPDLVVALLAVLKAGGAYVPIDPKYPPGRQAFMLEDSAAPVLVTRQALSVTFTYAGRVVDLDAIQDAVAEQPRTAPVTGATADDLAYVIYTSGSTGRPKGTMLRHSAGYLVDWARRTFSPEELSRVVAGTSICFDLSVFELFVPLCTGGAVILVADPLDPPHRASRPTLLNTVPSALAELAQVGGVPESVRTVVSCGEKLNNAVVQALYTCANVSRVYNVYGPTEYTTYATASLTVRGAMCDPPIGRPLCNTRVYVLDARRQLLPIGVAGELCIAGHGLARGYLGQAELTAERFVDDPFGPPGSRMYRTGDHVRWSPDGELEFIGRVDHQIKLRGFRIELGEIEASLRRHAAVRDAVVLTSLDQSGNARLTAYVVADGESPPHAALRRHLADWLPDYMVPSAFVVLPGFPLTPSGKVDRSALRAPSPHQPELAPEPGWMGWLQEIIADTFRRVLHVEHFGVGDNFFDKGGHSLQAVEAASHLEHILAQTVSPAWIFQVSTPYELAPLLAAAFATPTSHITPLQSLGDRPALFCLHGLVNRAFHFASLAPIMAPDQPVYGLVPGPLEDAFIANPTFDVLTPAYVAAIKATRPKGPYWVVGFSFGGVQAFDVAHALLAEGEEVLLIMIDPYIYGFRPNMAQAVTWVGRRSMAVMKNIWVADWPVTRRISETGRWTRRQGQRALRKFRQGLDHKRPPPDVGTAAEVPDWISPAARPLAAALIQAASTYQYRPYTGPVVFMQGTERDALLNFLNADGLNGWNGLFQGSLTRFELPANHYWMMRDPMVSGVAEILRSLSPTNVPVNAAGMDEVNVVRAT